MEQSKHINNVIYKIQHKTNPELFYVGHTIRFNRRKTNHKYCSKTDPQQVYATIRENGGWECFTMIILEEFPCENKTEALAREDKMIRELNPPMNSRGAKMVNDAYAIVKKLWRDNNKEKLNAKTECECGCIIYRRNMKRHLTSKTHQAKIELKSK